MRLYCWYLNPQVPDRNAKALKKYLTIIGTCEALEIYISMRNLVGNTKKFVMKTNRDNKLRFPFGFH